MSNLDVTRSWSEVEDLDSSKTYELQVLEGGDCFVVEGNTKPTEMVAGKRITADGHVTVKLTKPSSKVWICGKTLNSIVSLLEA